MADLVGLAERDPRLHAPPGHPDAEALAVVVATAGASLPFRDRKPADLPTPVDEGRVEEAARLQIGDEGRGRFVGSAADGGEPLADIRVVVPGLSPQKQLHKPHAPFHEPPGDQAARAVFLRDRVVEAVEAVGGLGLLGDVERVGGRELHPRGQLIAGDPGVEIGLTGMTLAVAAVESIEVGEVSRLERAGKPRGRDEIRDPRFFGAEGGALEEGRTKTARPVGDAIDGVPLRIDEHEVGGKIAGLAAQRVGEPAAERRPAEGGGDAAVEVTDRNLVAVVPGVHRTDEADVVGDPLKMGEQLADLRARLSAGAELPRAPQQPLARPVDEAVGDLAAIFHAVELLKLRLGIGEVHVGRAAMHEQRDHRRGPRLGMRGAGAEVAEGGLERRLGWICQQPFLTEEIGKRHRPQAEAALGEKASPPEGMEGRAGGRRTDTAA